MAWQLVFTSSPRTLTAGQSGYGTVARSPDLRDALIQRLEQLSYFQHWAGPAGNAVPPVIAAYRILDLRGIKYHLLTRIQDAGLDFTQRTNHLAHHLVFTPDELAGLPSPAVILRSWQGWRPAWTEEPRWLAPAEGADLAQLPRALPMPAKTWQRVTGDAGSAAALVGPPLAGGCALLCTPAEHLLVLDLFAESLELLDLEGARPAQKWQIPFTTCLQTADNASEFRWRVFVHGSPALKAQPGSSAAPVALSALRAPAGALAERARRAPRLGGALPAPAAPADVLETERPPLKLKSSPALTPGGVRSPSLEAGGEGARERGAGWRASPTAAAPSRRAPDRWGAWCASPRFLGPAIGLTLLFLLLLAGFVWPAWFVKPVVKTTDTRVVQPVVPPAPAAAAPPAKPARPPVKPPAQAPKPAPAPARFEPLSAAALAQLDQQVDQVRTYLVVANSGAHLELPPIPELENLAARLLPRDNSAPLSLDAIEGLATTGRVRLAPAQPAARLRARKDESEKSLSFESAQGPEFQVSFKDWWFSPAKPMLLQRLAARPESAALLVQATQPGTAVTPFRLLICDTRAAPAPLPLAKAWVRANQTNFAQSLHPAVLAKLVGGLILPPNHQFQLRPLIGGERRDLHDELQREAALEPPPLGQELDFNFARARLDRRIERTQKELARIASQMGNLSNAIAAANAADLELGQWFGFANPPNASLAAFAENAKLELDRETFRHYLVLLLRTRFKEPFVARLKPPGPTREFLERLPEQLARVGVAELPSNYFLNRWQSLGKVDELANKLVEQQQVQAQLDNFRANRGKIPADLAGAAEVRLYVVDAAGRRLVELIRFADTPARAP